MQSLIFSSYFCVEIPFRIPLLQIKINSCIEETLPMVKCRSEWQVNQPFHKISEHEWECYEIRIDRFGVVTLFSKLIENKKILLNLSYCCHYSKLK